MGRILLKIKKHYHIIFIAIFLLILTFPYLNFYTHIIKDVSLYGISVETAKPVYSVRGYLKGEYQANFDNYYLTSFPYRNVAIKSYNQLRYSLFEEGIVEIGKDKYLYQDDYIKEYLGIDENTSDEQLAVLIEDLVVINNICKEAGKEFYIVITPSKAHFLPEYIPEKYYRIAKENTNHVRYYDLLVNELQNNNIKYFDTCEDLKQSEMEEPIFYKTGTHWSYLASTHALSNFIKYIDNTSTLNLNKFNVIGSENAEKPYFGEDEDIYNLLNIYIGERDEKYYKPLIEYENKNAEDKKLFMQGGSFSWNLLYYMKKDIFTTIDFLFYEQFITRYDSEGNSTQEMTNNNKISKEQLEQVLLDKDIIILEVNQEYIRKWIDGFPKTLRLHLEEYGFPQG